MPIQFSALVIDSILFVKARGLYGFSLSFSWMLLLRCILELFIFGNIFLGNQCLFKMQFSGFLSSVDRFIYLLCYSVEYFFSLTVLVFFFKTTITRVFIIVALFSLIIPLNSNSYSLDIFLVFYSLFLVYLFLHFF